MFGTKIYKILSQKFTFKENDMNYRNLELYSTILLRYIILLIIRQ